MARLQWRLWQNGASSIARLHRKYAQARAKNLSLVCVERTQELILSKKWERRRKGVRATSQASPRKKKRPAGLSSGRRISQATEFRLGHVAGDELR
ncbi:hypothetical protein, partial [Methylocystis sp. Sn-Cys]|uniref:hypothetical protein n=1 Tax=Methylocystis sp. Sn-Cys TaxID=1701263 RepID=UPI001AED1567